MGYYLRFIITDTKPITLPTLKEALAAVDSRYRLILDPFDEQTSELTFSDELLGTIELNAANDDICREDINDLYDLIAHSPDDGTQGILDALKNAEAMVAVSARWQGDNPTPTLDKLEVLWDWLFANYTGILQADNDGIYDADGLILAMNLKI